MRISYAICVCNEEEEIKKLIPFLQTFKKEEDEIIVLLDKPKASEQLIEFLIQTKGIFLQESEFKGNFADWKNQLVSLCSGDYIFNIDADEIPNEYLIKNLPEMLSQNLDTDMIVVPRINTVEGITDEHIKRWGWKVNENGWINFPDGQTRIFRKSLKIKWSGGVHEKIIGYENFAFLPEIEQFCLYHHKTIERQEKQNNYYSSI